MPSSVYIFSSDYLTVGYQVTSPALQGSTWALAMSWERRPWCVEVCPLSWVPLLYCLYLLPGFVPGMHQAAVRESLKQKFFPLDDFTDHSFNVVCGQRSRLFSVGWHLRKPTPPSFPFEYVVMVQEVFASPGLFWNKRQETPLLFLYLAKKSSKHNPVFCAVVAWGSSCSVHDDPNKASRLEVSGSQNCLFHLLSLLASV
jgi:hypothetical protein